MHPSHPFIRQEKNKAVSSEMNQLRNLLYQQGKGIEVRLLKAEKRFSDEPIEKNRIELALLVGEAKGYVELRKSIQPKVAMDSFSSGLKAKAKRIEEVLHKDA